MQKLDKNIVAALNWTNIINLTEETELLSLAAPCFPVKDRLFPQGALYQFNDHEFATTFTRANDVRLIDRLYWAANIECFRGIILRAPNSEDSQRITPPDALLLKPGCDKFEDIQRAMTSGEFGSFYASPYGCSATIFEDGFIIGGGRRKYYFSASLANWAGQAPAVISWSLGPVDRPLRGDDCNTMNNPE